ALIALAAPAGAAPQRVVSMNLCTDQLALMLGAPGQLVSVSAWSARPSASDLAEQAARLPLNRGGAEQVYTLRPDLVLAGAFTNRASVALLRRLGLRVEVFPPARSFAELRESIARMGRLLGREDAAAALDAAFLAELAALRARAGRLARRGAAFHYPNSYTSGTDTLAHEIMESAGLDNAAARLGLAGVARLGLERLVMLRPFLIRTETLSGAATGRSYEPARHPALAEVAAAAGGAVLAERWQVCGTPFVTRAIAALLAAREGSGGERGGGGEGE
ncbi:ABC transporter substrate-binding protein, partial [Paralimibaculum aggregatum]|uniref:ABC transporter substrate-binding protein n=1 Tax=Paralimibaculum aggregatum TaxID=3036245 RepID=UPI002552ECB2